MRAAYDQWWSEVLPAMVNEDAVGPKINPFKALYYEQFGGEPSEALLKRMDPTQVLTPRKNAKNKKNG
jgi:arylsulfatase